MFARLSVIMLAGLALFANAKPIGHNSVDIRVAHANVAAVPSVDLSKHVGAAPALDGRSDCGCSNDLITILTGLEAQVNVALAAIVEANPSEVIAEVVALVNAAASAAADIKITTPFASADITLCAQICVNIILAIVVALSKCNLAAAVDALVELDAALKAGLSIWVNLWPGISVAIGLGLVAHVDLLLLTKLTAVLGFLGL